MLKQSGQNYEKEELIISLFLFLIYFFASDTYNLDHMYPYQVLVIVTGKKVLEGKGIHNIVADHAYILSRCLSVQLISGFHVQSKQIAIYARGWGK